MNKFDWKNRKKDLYDLYHNINNADLDIYLRQYQ